MTTPEKGAPEPSMEEILSSIRQLIATDSDPKSRPPIIEGDEDILDLTNLLPDEACSSTNTKAKKLAAQGKRDAAFCLG
jgi:hypothetical protein